MAKRISLICDVCTKTFNFGGTSPTNKLISRMISTALPGVQIRRNPFATRVRHDDEKTQSDRLHIPVLAEQVLEIIQPKRGQVILDMTFGAGGHTRSLLDRAPDCHMFCLDRDPVAHDLAKRLASRRPQITPLLGRFSEVHHLVAKHGITENMVDAILFDVGASSMQFDTPGRGFSISHDAPLDMRMDGERVPDQPSAADVINHMDESGLFAILKKYGEEKRARLIARAIIDSRYAFGRIKTTSQVAEIVASVYQCYHGQDKLMRPAHVATKTFQALRIFVNNELNELNNGLEIAYSLLKPGGVCVAISFHSLEDRIVKRHFHGIDMDAKFNMGVAAHHRNQKNIHSVEFVQKLLEKKWEPYSKKVIVPRPEEEEANPRSRSAKLRAAYKLPS